MDANHDSVCARAVRCARAAIAPTHVEHGERRSRATVRDEGAMKEARSVSQSVTGISRSRSRSHGPARD